MLVLSVVLKGLIGGTLVVAFALIGETVRPRGLAGITSAAPSIAAAAESPDWITAIPWRPVG
jgi:hypothetical protein